MKDLEKITLEQVAKEIVEIEESLFYKEDGTILFGGLVIGKELVKHKNELREKISRQILTSIFEEADHIITEREKENEENLKDKLVENIIILAHKLNDKNKELFEAKDYLEALHDGRIDYTAEKEATAKARYRIAEAERNIVIKELKELFE